MALKIGAGITPPTTGVSYQKHLVSKPVTGIISSTKAVKGEVIAEAATETETLHPGVFSNGMSITVEGGRVINLGNYETARIGVSITVPCAPETLDEAYTYATEWVTAKIEEAMKAAKE